MRFIMTTDEAESTVENESPKKVGRRKNPEDSTFNRRIALLVQMEGGPESPTKKISYNELARRTKGQVGRATITDLVRGKHTNPTYNTIKALARALNVHESFFFTEDEEGVNMADVQKSSLVIQMSGSVLELDLADVEDLYKIVSTMVEVFKERKQADKGKAID
jgi:transcriptional regulator with XRE-family HTH domain